MDAAQAVHEKFLAALAEGKLPDRADAPDPALIGLSRAEATDIFLSQLTSRQMDRLSRHLQARGEGFYTIGSSGHEGNAAVAAALRVTDMAFLHYRSNAFQLHRSRQIPGQTATWDMLLSFAASSDDPISGGRHKVLGSRTLMIPPQTSTIASHLPKAVGAAYSIGAARRHRPEHAILPEDALVMCSFGDASANHSTAQGAFNTAQWTSYQSVPLPLLFVCEDNGIGISTKTPKGWIEATFGARPGLAYFKADGLDLYDTYRVAVEAAEFARTRKKPAFLHLRTIRLYGHAGADVPTTYLPREEVEAEEAQDPLLHAVRLLDQAGVMTPDQALEVY
ncbi:MAG: MFS transporter, partial [Acetobacteraceae bacterium]